MNEKIAKKRKNMLKKSITKDFDKEIHKVKVPKDEKGRINKSIKPKTILLDNNAHSVLERIKLESNEPAYTFSDVIDFLVTQNKIKAE